MPQLQVQGGACHWLCCHFGTGLRRQPSWDHQPTMHGLKSAPFQGRTWTDGKARLTAEQGQLQPLTPAPSSLGITLMQRWTLRQLAGLSTGPTSVEPEVVVSGQDKPHRPARLLGCQGCRYGNGAGTRHLAAKAAPHSLAHCRQLCEESHMLAWLRGHACTHGGPSLQAWVVTGSAGPDRCPH